MSRGESSLTKNDIIHSNNLVTTVMAQEKIFIQQPHQSYLQIIPTEPEEYCKNHVEEAV